MKAELWGEVEQQAAANEREDGQKGIVRFSGFAKWIVEKEKWYIMEKKIERMEGKVCDALGSFHKLSHLQWNDAAYFLARLKFKTGKWKDVSIAFINFEVWKGSSDVHRICQFV